MSLGFSCSYLKVVSFVLLGHDLLSKHSGVSEGEQDTAVCSGDSEGPRIHAEGLPGLPGEAT